MHDEDRVTESVLRQMSELAAAFPDTETGAIGLGRDGQSLSLLIPAGPTALRTQYSFGLDPDFLNPRLEEARKRGLRWTAVWHVHPKRVSELSQTDRASAQALLNDPETGLEGRLLLPLSTRTGTGIETRFYVAEGQNARIRRLSPAVVSDEQLPQAGRTAEPRTHTAHHLFNAEREARLAKDIPALRKAGFEVTRREGAGGQCTLRASRKNVALWAILPIEYPATPPQFYVEEGDSLRVVPARDLSTLLGWSSLHSLVVLIREAEASVQSDREAESLILRPRAFEFVRRHWPGNHRGL